MDGRLKKKDEVFVLKIDGYKGDPIAISIDYLKKENIYQGEIAETEFLVITKKDGLTRAYESQGIKFHSYRNGKLLDTDKKEWVVEEDNMISPYGKYLARLPGHNIFWFAWFNVVGDTRLIY